MRKILIAGVLSLFLGVSVLFSGCGTDLSGVNSQIQQMQQQIDSLNQTILDLQNRLNEAEENQQDLLLDFTTAQGKFLTLEEQVFGKVNNYYNLNETLYYSVNSSVLFSVTPIVAVFNNNYVIGVNFESYITSANINSEIFNISAILYDCNTSSTIALNRIVENSKTFEEYQDSEFLLIFNSSQYYNNNFILFLYSNTNLIGIIQLNFDELSS